MESRGGTELKDKEGMMRNRGELHGGFNKGLGGRGQGMVGVWVQRAFVKSTAKRLQGNRLKRGNFITARISNCIICVSVVFHVRCEIGLEDHGWKRKRGCQC